METGWYLKLDMLDGNPDEKPEGGESDFWLNVELVESRWMGSCSSWWVTKVDGIQSARSFVPGDCKMGECETQGYPDCPVTRGRKLMMGRVVNQRPAGMASVGHDVDADVVVYVDVGDIHQDNVHEWLFQNQTMAWSGVLWQDVDCTVMLDRTEVIGGDGGRTSLEVGSPRWDSLKVPGFFLYVPLLGEEK